ncbi:hypothetical protein GLW05_03450 [Pontibacillus yanchengensis]|uniref:Uncharacterized protein n=1 Tax=Pontibacillus yanchengensis TaxID=462910 RepID=A0A6I4ZQW2_9BACI|nr:hypothetical protein [Pontibacillus yanchengensis]MYL32645.1 hypothetical protein [Pontibacillus yanchengensis]
MEVNKIRNELSIRGKNGIGFLQSAVIIWLIITAIFAQTIEINQKNIYMLYSTGLMFPLSVVISTFIKADWKLKNNPLGNIGVILNIAQIIYFPILIWGIIKSPGEAIMLFAIITGAHFFPYGWYYNAIPYYVMSPVICIVMMVLAMYVKERNLWLEPLTMAVLLSLLILWLYIDYRNKHSNISSPH